MARWAWPVLAGALIGSTASAVWFGAIAVDSSRSSSSAGSLDAGGAASALPEVAPDAFALEMLAAERAAAALPSDLEASIEAAAVAAPSAASDAEIEAMLMQLAETDPGRALDLAAELGLDRQVEARLIQLWAAREPDATLAALGRIPSSARQRALALALLETFGVDPAGMERVAAVLAPSDAVNFRFDALARFAGRDLPGALAATMNLNSDQEGMIAQQRIAELMAHIDPERGLEAAGHIDIALLRRYYRDRLLDEWAKLDPDAMFVWLETADLSELLLSIESFRALATREPERLLELADRFGPFQRFTVQQAAVDTLADIDPLTAYQLVMRLPANNDRNNLLSRIAEQYAGEDPEAALAWANSLNPRSPIITNRVLSSLAIADPERAADLVIAEIQDPVAANRGEMPFLTSVLSEAMQGDAPEIIAIADRVATHSDPRVRAQLDQLVNLWSQTDPERASDWVVAHPDELSVATATNIGSIVGGRDPALARRMFDDLPPAVRGSWLAGAARGWAAQDAPAAERWVLAMPVGAERDQGLGGLVQQAASRNSFDEQVLEAFSADATRAQILLRTMLSFGRSNPELGRSLIERYITDPAMRAQAEQQLTAGARLPANIIILP